MGLSRLLISLAAAQRRHEREAARAARLAEERYRRSLKQNAADRAAAEVALFEARIDALTSIHRESVDPMDWTAVLQEPLPSAPPEPRPPGRMLSNEARAALEAHSRSLTGRLWGSKRRAELEQALLEAEYFDNASEQKLKAEYEAQRTAYVQAVKEALELRELAARILDGDLQAQLEAIQLSGCLDEIAATLGQEHLRLTATPHRTTVVLHVDQETVVPAEQKTLTQKGTVSSKKFAASRRLEIYEDYVCGAALRAAREIMATIPTPGVLVHVETMRVVPSTGHLASCVILSVLVPRQVLDDVHWHRVDASELVSTLHHNMKLKKRGSGFEPVEKLSFAEP
jgi:hypothetical protein